MGHKYSHDQILGAAVRVAASSGLNGLSFRLVAEEVGTSDRVIIYYFGEKSQLLTAILGHVGEKLKAMLAVTLPSSRPGSASRLDVLIAARQTFADPNAAQATRLFLEAVGLSIAGTEPYSSLVPQLLQGWIAWLDEQMGTDGARSSEAAAIVALVEGLLIIGLLLGPDSESAAWGVAIGQARKST